MSQPELEHNATPETLNYPPGTFWRTYNLLGSDAPPLTDDDYRRLGAQWRAQLRGYGERIAALDAEVAAFKSGGQRNASAPTPPAESSQVTLFRCLSRRM
jgi:hypothetical protein